MARGPLSEMEDPEDEDLGGYPAEDDEHDGHDDGEDEEDDGEEDETPEEKECREAGEDFKEALDEGDGMEIFEAFEHMHNLATERMEQKRREGGGDHHEGPGGHPIAGLIGPAILAVKRKAGRKK